jgi:hypothetical protein
MTASKIQEGKYSVDTDLTFAVVVYLEVLDLAERLKDTGQVKSPPLLVILVHILIIISV